MTFSVFPLDVCLGTLTSPLKVTYGVYCPVNSSRFDVENFPLKLKPNSLGKFASGDKFFIEKLGIGASSSTIAFGFTRSTFE